MSAFLPVTLPAMTCRAVDLWDVVPATVESWLSRKGLEAAYRTKRWRSFRQIADGVLTAEEPEGERLLYLDYMLAMARNPDPAGDTGHMGAKELVGRLNLLKQAGDCALASVSDNHRIMALIYRNMELCYRFLGDYENSLAVKKVVIEHYFDVPVYDGSSAYEPLLGDVLTLYEAFRDAGMSDESAIEWLRELSQQHPVREFRLAALVSLGYQFAGTDRLADARDVLAGIDSSYSDLDKQSDAFASSIGLLRSAVDGTCHLNMNKRGLRRFVWVERYLSVL